MSALVYGLFFAKLADVIYAYHPPLTVGMVASFIRIFRRIPVVYDVQDMWPDTLRATGMVNNASVLNLVSVLCRWVYKQVDHIVVLSPGFKALLLERGVPGAKVDVIYNWADEASLFAAKNVFSLNLPSADSFSILFAGNMVKAQALSAVLEAANLLQERNSRVCFVLLGEGVELEKLKQIAEIQQLRNVVFIPQMPMADVGVALNAADVLLVHLRKDPLFEITIPSKTQAYMAIGKPVLMAVNGDAATLIEVSGCGVVVQAGDAKSLANAAELLALKQPAELKMMGNKAQAYYLEHLQCSVGAAKFSAIFKRQCLEGV